jgi:hypothetical protein
MPRKRLLLFLVSFALFSRCETFGQWIGRPEPGWEKTFQTWVADPHKKVYPNSFGRDLARRQIELQACRNEWVIIQLGVRSPQAVKSLSVRASELTTADGEKIGSNLIRIRYQVSSLWMRTASIRLTRSGKFPRFPCAPTKARESGLISGFPLTRLRGSTKVPWTSYAMAPRRTLSTSS